MMPSIVKKRCACYVRKSVEDRLELELKTCGVKSLLEEFKNE